MPPSPGDSLAAPDARWDGADGDDGDAADPSAGWGGDEAEDVAAAEAVARPLWWCCRSQCRSADAGGEGAGDGGRGNSWTPGHKERDRHVSVAFQI